MARPLRPDFVRRLTDIVGSEHVLTDAESLAPFASDETPNLTPSAPDVVVRPATPADVAAVMKACADERIPVTPRGAGTGKSGGCVPVNGGVVLALSRLTRIEDIDTSDGVVDVEPGVVLGDLHALVEGEGLFYPPDPASLSSCTLGGNVAENAGGPRALKYGVTRDYVLGLDVVLQSGEAMRVGRRTTKGVAGYDLTSLIVGSEGTLAVVTGITLKLLPRPRAVQTALAVFPSAQHAADLVARVARLGVSPRTMELVDRASIDALAKLSLPARFAAGAGAALLIETDADDEAAALASLARVLDACTEHGALDTQLAQGEKQRRDLWATRRMLSEATRRIKAKKVSEDVVVPRQKIPELIARASQLGDDHGLFVCSFGHAGDGNLHVQVCFDEDSELMRVDALLEDLFRETVRLGGTITGEHGIGIAKRTFLSLEQAEPVLELQRRIKAAFDPMGLLNPGKLLPDKAVLRAARESM